MRPVTREAKIEAAYVEHQEATQRFELVRTLSDERGSIGPVSGVLTWAINDLGRTGLILARLRAHALGMGDVRNISGAGTLAHLDREQWQVRLSQTAAPRMQA